MTGCTSHSRRSAHEQLDQVEPTFTQLDLADECLGSTETPELTYHVNPRYPPSNQHVEVGIDYLKRSGETMAKYLIARNDKLSGRKGLMGVLRIDNEVKPRRNASEVSTLFPRRIANRAALFSVVEALDLDALVAKYGPEI